MSFRKLGLVFAGSDRCRYQIAGDMAILHQSVAVVVAHALARVALQADMMPEAARTLHAPRMAMREL